MSDNIRLGNAFGVLLFVALVLTVSPALVVPTGFAFGLWLCGLIMYDEWTIRAETRSIDSEHERL